MSEQALVPCGSAVPVENVTVAAESIDEMGVAQEALIEWVKNKLVSLRHDHSELLSAYEHAKKMKWQTAALSRHAGLAAKRVEFYVKMLSALEHGYQIVPNFPVTCFAIRTDRNKPLKMATTSSYAQMEQRSSGLPAEDGEYKNPFPEIWYRIIEPAKEGKAAVKEYYAKEWRDLEFPLTMAKPKMMTAATRAMALKIFDDLGILPGQRSNADPLIVARLLVPSWNKYDRKYVTFIVGWMLNTNDLP